MVDLSLPYKSYYCTTATSDSEQHQYCSDSNCGCYCHVVVMKGQIPIDNIVSAEVEFPEDGLPLTTVIDGERVVIGKARITQSRDGETVETTLDVAAEHYNRFFRDDALHLSIGEPPTWKKSI